MDGKDSPYFDRAPLPIVAEAASRELVVKVHGRIVVPKMYCALRGDNAACMLAQQCARHDGLLWHVFDSPSDVITCFEEQHPTDLLVLLYSEAGAGSARFAGKHVLDSRFWIDGRHAWRWAVGVEPRAVLNGPEISAEVVRVFGKANLGERFAARELPWGERIDPDAFRSAVHGGVAGLRKTFRSDIEVAPPATAAK